MARLPTKSIKYNNATVLFKRMDTPFQLAANNDHRIQLKLTFCAAILVKLLLLFADYNIGYRTQAQGGRACSLQVKNHQFFVSFARSDDAFRNFHC